MNDLFISCRESKIENPRSFYGCFHIGPLNSSHSLTVANALRRTLLSELSGIAITSVEIEGAAHEYSTLPGIYDSVLDILLNLKQIVLKSFSPDSALMTKQFNRPLIGYLQARGPGIVKAADLKLPVSIQCVDSDQYIANLSTDGVLNMKFTMHRGKNYMIQNPKNFTHLTQQNTRHPFSEPAQFTEGNLTKKAKFKPLSEREKTRIRSMSTMPLSIDAVFMPVNKVNYVIENHSVNHINALNFLKHTSQNEVTRRTSSVDLYDPAEQKKVYYEKTFSNNIIILEVWTNGSIYPRRAVYDALKNLMCLFSQLEKMKILNYLFTTELVNSNETSEKIFKKVEYDYEYYSDMQNSLKKSKTKNQLSPEAFLYTQKTLEKKHKPKMFDEKELKKIRISNLNISNRSRKLLENSQINNVADLITNSNRQLTSIKGFGKKCLQEVKQALEKIGVDFINE